MAYSKQAWRDYDDTKTENQNRERGAIVTPERMNHIETGIANSADKQEVTSQLAQKVGGGNKAELEDLSSTVLSAIEGGEGTSFDLLSIPQDKSVTPKKTTFLKTIVGKNLFDKSKVEKSRDINQDGVYYNSGASDLSDFIPVKPSTIYSAYGHTGNRIHEFNVNEEHVKTTLPTSTITTTPETAYIRIAVPKSGDWLDRAMLVEDSSIPDYEPYKEFYKIENLIVDNIDEEPIPNDTNQTYLRDKKIAIIGDSITSDNRYIPTVQERIGTPVLNQGIGGTRVAKMGDDIDHRSMVERSKHHEATVTFDTRVLLHGDLNHDEGTISRVLNDANPRFISKWLKLGASGEGSWSYISPIEPENVDIMAILHGTNDYSNGVPLGDVDSLDEFTFYGAYNKTIENVLNRNHNVKLMLITPLWRVTAYDNNPIGLTLVDYVKAVKNIAEKYNLPCLDLFSTSGINEHNYTTMFGDRIHPNATGGVRIGNIIASFILNGY